MTEPKSTLYDIVGIGLGPNGLGLAAAVTDHNRAGLPSVNALFIDKNERFDWHPGMMVSGARMQISFLKDLATARDPKSPFTFVNYLHSTGRLEEFINLHSMTPFRVEYGQYLSWAAHNVETKIDYGVSVTKVSERDGLFEIERSDGDSIYARNVAVNAGAMPHVPASFDAGTRASHSSKFLELRKRFVPGSHVLVIGGGQSAVEVAESILSEHPGVSVEILQRHYSLAQTDTSKFENRSFMPDASLEFGRYELSARKAMWAEDSLNFGVASASTLDRLYELAYEANLRAGDVLDVVAYASVEKCVENSSGITAEYVDTRDKSRRSSRADFAVYCTGYSAIGARDLLSEDLKLKYVVDSGLNADFSLPGTPSIAAGGKIYGTGCAEMSHGVSACVLSNVAFRAATILDQVVVSKVPLYQ